ncbi:MAG: DUF433 domain-containing protein [Nitriliruptorales bacterium]
MATTFLVVGDVAGHLTALDEVLAPFDVCVSESEVPAGTVVVQVVDLIGRSDESARLIACVDGLRDRSPDRWVQLAGNHELHHLGGHQFQGTRNLPDDAVATMRAWLDEGWMRVAVALGVGDSAVLVSHAGLTRGLWTELGAPREAGDAVAALESLRLEPAGWEVINRPGRMLNLGRFPIVEPTAGPVWAEASIELLPPWIDRGDLPFDQVHGHSSGYDWFRGRVRNRALADHCEIDRERRHVVARIGARTITGIDPSLWPGRALALGAARRRLERMTGAHRDLISRDPKIRHGQAVIKGTRVMVSIVLDALAARMAEQDILSEYPTLTVDGIRAAAAYGADLARDEYPAVAAQ